MAFLYWVESKGGYWTYFFPTESHVIGMNRIKGLLDGVDQHNFLKNIDETVEKPFTPADRLEYTTKQANENRPKRKISDYT
jgi:hypothetical protein